MRDVRLFFALGVAVGIFLIGSLWFYKNKTAYSPTMAIVAQVQNKKLTESELRKRASLDLIPIENDESIILNQAANQWLEEQLLEKDVKDRGISIEQIHQELWNKAQVSPNEMVDFYLKNKQLYQNQPFEKVNQQIFKELRQKAYDHIKEKYIEDLGKKYDAKIFIAKPSSFVEGSTGFLPTQNLPVKPILDLAILSAPPAPPPAPTIIFYDLQDRPSKGAEDAKVTLVEFSDFNCPFCKRVEPTLDQLMTKYEGKIRRVWRHYPLGQGSERVHEASECAFEQGKFWEYHDKLFETQGTPRDDKKLTEFAKELGLNEQQFQTCMSSNKATEQVKKDVQKGNAVGVTGTPAVFINGQMISGAQPYPNFERIVESVLNPDKVLPPVPPQPSVIKFDDLKDKPSIGPDNAKVTLVEFSDFHCPFCKKLNSTLKELMKNNQGKMRHVWRHYPLPMHPQATRTHEASECAAEQEKFWEYHDEVFKQDVPPQDDAQRIQLAKNIGLNERKFQACLTSEKYKEKIQKDIQKGQQLGVRGTPAAFVNGKLISGAQSYTTFDQAIQKELSQS